MILKLDHVSYSCTYEEEKEILKQFEGYKEVFFESNLINIDAKKTMMKHFCKYHNIRMLEKDSFIPIELTTYKSCEGNNNAIELKKDYSVIMLHTTNIENTYDFFSNLEIYEEEEVKDGIILSFQPLLSKELLKIYIHKVEKINFPMLDYKGYGAIGIFVDKTLNYMEKFKKNGYFVTEIETLKVNRKNLKIFFVKGKQGEILEIIGVR